MEGEMINLITEECKEQKIDVNNSIFEERKEFKIDVNENLELHGECCIYRVPKALRKLNEEAYTPKVISIGPLHHGKDEFADMEKQKIRYKREFRKRVTKEKWQEIINFIEENEGRIRNCYAERPMLPKLDFITMILYDAVFIIELFLRYSLRNYHGDFLLDISRMLGDIRADLQLLENQLPFYVLNDLYNLAFHYAACKPCSFFSLSCQFFNHCEPNEVPVRVEIDKHFTDLSRYFLKKKHPEPLVKKHFRELPCAVKLQESGVKFNNIKQKNTLGNYLDVRYFKKQQRCLKVDDVLQIPSIEIDDSTERLFRNVMALEQCHYPKETLVCNYVDLMDILIETEEDVNLLVESGIISINLGDSATVARMFNKLCLEITSSPSIYGEISQKLRAHYDDRWNHAKATLKIVYFTDLWRGTATVAAVVLLLLTLIQTVFSILSIV